MPMCPEDIVKVVGGGEGGVGYNCIFSPMGGMGKAKENELQMFQHTGFSL